MKRLLLVLLLHIAFVSFSHAQYLQNLRSEIQNVIAAIPNSLSSKFDSQKLLNKCEAIQKDIDEALEEDEDLEVSDFKKLKEIRNQAKDLNNFIRAVGNTHYGTGLMSDQLLGRARALVNFDLSEISMGKFCINLYKFTIGKYYCVLGFNPSPYETYKINAVCKSRNGKSSFSSEFGLSPKFYRQLLNSEDIVGDYFIKSINCSKYDSPQTLPSLDY